MTDFTTANMTVKVWYAISGGAAGTPTTVTLDDWEGYPEEEVYAPGEDFIAWLLEVKDGAK